ncbi:MAG: hypothetical protein GXP62_15275 [Oligoflexia bacterium]|nr:hypothetical protein [Oligoflexia bacterium]
MLLSLSIILLAACTPETPSADRTPLTVQAGDPIAGMAQGVLDLPVGAPMGGFSSRTIYLGGSSKVDNRKSPYPVGFVPSAGVHTPARAQALWLEAGNEQLVLLRLDLIYSFDGFVDEIESRLTAATGIDMQGKVVVATAHTHQMVGDFTKQEGFFLGGDRYDEEIFQRIVGGLTDLALQAYDSRVDAAIGIGMAKDWDPDDKVYRDRRDENDNLDFFEDIPPGSYKDPNLWILRVDTAAGEPLGFFFTFGMHGTTLSEDNPLLSTDSVGGITRSVEETFDTPLVVAHLQGGGGDASPAGTDDGMARIETIGEYGAQAIHDLWEATPTSTQPIKLQSASRGISMERDQISVHRSYADLVYSPFDDDPDYHADDVVYDDQGQIISPIDEFNAQYGGVFCGYEDPLISSGTIGSDAFPYDGCMDVGLISSLIFGIFGLDIEQMELPLAHMMRANSTAARIDGIAIHTADGQDVDDTALIGFFPGETTSLYSEQFRRRAKAELGYDYALPVGYAQDHEGYLLIPEDWLMGGYEPNITFWGPLGAEHIMEGMLQMVDERLGDDLIEPADPLGLYPTTTYDDWPLGVVPPDTTPQAGTWADTVPKDLYTPLQENGLQALTAPPAQLRRVQDAVQIVWHGGDPMVDSPKIVLERESKDGTFQPVTTRSGREVSSDRTDIIMTWLPDPLYPAEAEQTHTWWAAWQAVSWGEDRAGLPTGTYRLRIEGERYLGTATTWPWDTEPYELTTDPFELLPAELDLTATDSTVSARILAPPWGWRLVDLAGNSKGSNPLVEPTLTWLLSDGTESTDESVATVLDGWSVFDATAPSDAISAVVTDAYGNSGTVDLAVQR